MNTAGGLPYYRVHTFTRRLNGGNPAGVCLCGSQWPVAGLMQLLAGENNLSETAFVVSDSQGYSIRWFTPQVEIDLCGHATLAAAFVLFQEGLATQESISFSSRSGVLTVSRESETLVLDMPADTLVPEPLTSRIYHCFAARPYEVLRGRSDLMFVFEKEEYISQARVNLAAIADLDARGVMITSPGRSVDFVSRFFGPRVGVDEDPVTGSAHTSLAVYWAGRLGKTELTALQLSQRRGELTCRVRGDRVLVAGRALIYSRGEILIPENTI